MDSDASGGSAPSLLPSPEISPAVESDGRSAAASDVQNLKPFFLFKKKYINVTAFIFSEVTCNYVDAYDWLKIILLCLVEYL